jgi:hypothetical protein
MMHLMSHDPSTPPHPTPPDPPNPVAEYSCPCCRCLFYTDLSGQREQPLSCPAAADIASSLQQVPATTATTGAAAGDVADLTFTVNTLADMSLPCSDPATLAPTNLAAAVRAAAYSRPTSAPAPAQDDSQDVPVSQAVGTPGYITGQGPSAGDKPGVGREPAPAPVPTPDNAPTPGLGAGPGPSGGTPRGAKAAIVAGAVVASAVVAALLGLAAYKFGYQRWWRHRGWQREELVEGGIGMVMIPAGQPSSAPGAAAAPAGPAPAPGAGGAGSAVRLQGQAAAAAAVVAVASDTV